MREMWCGCDITISRKTHEKLVRLIASEKWDWKYRVEGEGQG